MRNKLLAVFLLGVPHVVNAQSLSPEPPDGPSIHVSVCRESLSLDRQVVMSRVETGVEDFFKARFPDATLQWSNDCHAVVKGVYNFKLLEAPPHLSKHLRQMIVFIVPDPKTRFIEVQYDLVGRIAKQGKCPEDMLLAAAIEGIIIKNMAHGGGIHWYQNLDLPNIKRGNPQGFMDYQTLQAAGLKPAFR